MVNGEMKAKNFNNGLKQYLSQDYFYVGIMIAVAMLQNGQMPAFIEDYILQEILATNKPLDQCVSEFLLNSHLHRKSRICYKALPDKQVKFLHLGS